MSSDARETLLGCIFDEYSIKDTISALIRESNLTEIQSKEFIKDNYEKGIFKIYKDAYEGTKHFFVDVDLHEIDLKSDNINLIFLTKG